MKPTPAQLRALARADPALGRAMRDLPAFPGFPLRGHYESHFHALASAIIHQQLAGKAARTIHDRVAALGGNAFPDQTALLALPDEALRGAGLSRGKLAALRDLATKTRDGTLDLSRVARSSDEEAIENLTQVRGIGQWTAQMFLLFRLGRLDVFAPGDLGLQEGARILDGRRARPSPKQLARRAEAWRPLRSVASWYLWRLVSPP